MFSLAYCWRKGCNKPVQSNELVVVKAIVNAQVLTVGVCSNACKNKVLNNK